MLRLAQERDSLSVVADQHGVPTSARWMAQVTREVLQRSDHVVHSGLFHLSNAGQTTWHGYARYVLDQAARMGWSLKVHADDIKAISTADYPCQRHDPPTPCLTPVCYSKNLAWPFPLGKLGWTRFWPP